IARPLIFGIRDGAAYGLVAVGLVLIYKSSRVFNFAAGEFATMGAFATYLIYSNVHSKIGGVDVGFLIAAAGGIGMGVLCGLLTERFVVRPLSTRPRVVILVATAAVAVRLIPLQIALGNGAKAYHIPPVVAGNAFHL